MSENNLRICKDALEAAECELRGLRAVLEISADGAPISDGDCLSDVFMSLEITAAGILSKLKVCIDAMFHGDAQRAES